MRWQEHVMDQAGFWKIVQAANDASGGDMDRKCDALRQQISSLSKADAIEFAQLFDAMMGKAYSFPLGARLMSSTVGCSDDTFDDFCSSLISRGRQAFERRPVGSRCARRRGLSEIGLVLRRVSIRRHRSALAGCRPSAATEHAGSTCRRRVARGRTRHLVSETQRKVRMIARGVVNLRSGIRLRL